jgi:hypothetical protein
MGNASHTGTTRETGLHVCPSCTSRLVQPVCWEQTEERGHWHLWRRCPECSWQGDGVHDDLQIDAYDLELDSGTETLAVDLQQIARENMERMAETFVAALDADLITAEDFG